jgi:hypothetical protein
MSIVALSRHFMAYAGRAVIATNILNNFAHVMIFNIFAHRFLTILWPYSSMDRTEVS